MIFFLTFNDSPSGIYSSQVIDVVKFIKNECKKETRLVAFISLRGFGGNRKKIKQECADAIVLPMVPGVSRWRLNAITLRLLCLIKKPGLIIGRSVLATHLAFKMKNAAVIYDGRGAISEEWKEYSVITDPVMLSEIHDLEREAVLNSDFRIAVSQQLYEYWQSTFGYRDHKQVIIPCTLNKVFEQLKITEDSVVKARQMLGLNVNDTVFIYSGSIAGWQSFELLYNFISPKLRSGDGNKIIFLAQTDKNILKLKEEFPTQVIQKKVSPEEVPHYLQAADYGLLVREQSVTNKVASPVKFAEYLACGLKVIISPNLGDYSEFVAKHKCGFFLNDSVTGRVNLAEKQRLNQLALLTFSKKFYSDAYKVLVQDNN